MQLFRLSSFLLLTLLFVLIVSCDTEDPFSVDPPDFTTVPEPYDTSNLESIDLSDGVRAYIHDEGYGPFEITLRDQVGVFLTLRTESGEILYSTFSDDRTTPVSVTMGLADGLNPAIHQNIFDKNTILLTYTPGFKKGLLGMQEGEKMTLIVSPEEGYQNIPQNSVNSLYRDETLIYDIRISNISPSKSR